MIMLILW